MKKTNYDVIVIGAGPAGLFFAYTLAVKEKGKKILIIDKGHNYQQRKCPLLRGSDKCECTICDIISGIGGAAFYVPAKLSNYPAGSKLSSFFENESHCQNMYLETLNIFKNLGLNAAEKTNINLDEKFNKYMKMSSDNDMYLKYYFSQEFSKDNFSIFITNFVIELKRLNVEIVSNTEIMDINKTDNHFNLLDKNNNQYNCKKLVLASGESGSFWLNDIIEKFNIEKKVSSIDIGIRIEFSKNILKGIYDYHKDPKFIFNAPDESELRTYCTLSNGKVVICKNNNFRVVDGIHCNYDNGIGAMTLFNRIFPPINITEYAMNASKIVNEKCNNRIARSTMGDLLNSSKTEKKNIQTLNYSKNIDLSEVIPEQILNNLRFGINKLSAIIKGLDSPQNIIYYPAIDKLWSELILKDNFETSLENLYVIGDSTGIARGIFQSALMGYQCANNINNI